MPMQFGPIKEPLTLLIDSTISFSKIFPSSFPSTSLKPAESIINALVFFNWARNSTVAGTYCAAIAMIAKSISGNSAGDW